MKTRINKRLLATAVCIMMCMTAVVRAQNDSLDGDYRASCQSTWTKYNNLTKANSIVRSNNIYRVAYIK